MVLSTNICKRCYSAAVVSTDDPFEMFKCSACGHSIERPPRKMKIPEGVVDSTDKAALGRLGAEARWAGKRVTPETIDKVRQRFEIDNASQASIAREFGLAQSTVHRIVHYYAPYEELELLIS